MANELRLSQLITTFGPGAMLDLPNRSVMIGGLDLWQVTDQTSSRVLNEPRLQMLLERALREAGRLGADASISLRTPPVAVDGPAYLDPQSVQAMVFPTLFICERPEPVNEPNLRRRRLVSWQQLDANSHRHKYRMPDMPGDGLVSVTPIRFIGACQQGHIEDINWRGLVHQGAAECSLPMFLEERGTSGSPDDTAIACDCGRRLTLRETTIPWRLGHCHGRRPWLGPDKQEPCENELKLLIRTATNTYFPQVVTVISLSQEVEELAKAVEAIWPHVCKVDNIQTLEILAEHSPIVGTALKGFDIAACLQQIRTWRAGDVDAGSAQPRIAEFDLLASGKAEIGSPAQGSLLYAQTLPRSDWDRSSAIDTQVIANVVAVHRLREVSCLYGFTRFEPAPTIEDDIEEIQLAVAGAPLSEAIDWLPAIEQFGEGIFIEFEPSHIKAWMERSDVIARSRQLHAGFHRWQHARGGRTAIRFPGMAYILLHSLSHAMMIEMALESGYPASSLKERIYALRDPAEPDRWRLGILIYTASLGAQGTLGGLVGSAARVIEIIGSALERLSICSNDPICADHSPAGDNDDRLLHGAACHGCLLVSETSCEKRNEFLDRAVLVETMGAASAAFFGSMSDVSTDSV